MMLRARAWNKNKKTSGGILSGLIAGILTLASATSRAAEAPVEAQAQRQYDIPSGPLDSALKSFASQSGVMLSANAALTAGKSTPGLKGSYTIVRGFEMLLAGSGLQATEGTAGDFSLRPRTTANAEVADATTLRKIKVESEVGPDGTAAQGYRSNTVSAVGPWQGRTLQDTPYSVTVIPRELIENLQATTPDQIYRAVPTVQVGEPSYRNDEPTLNMRGFQVYLPYRDGMYGDYIGLSTTTEDVERVEVFTGLSGFLYGPGNVGGMINYVSKRPTAERLNRVTLGSNDGGNWYLQGDLGGPIDSEGRLGYRINGIWQDGETAIDNMEIEKRFISGAFDWHVTDTLLLRFDAAYREYEIKGGSPVWLLAADATRPSAEDIDASKSWSQPWKEIRDELQRYSAQLRWDANETFTLRAAWLYTNTQRDPNVSANNTIQANGTYTQVIRRLYAPGDNAFEHEFSSSSAQAFADIHFKTGAVTHTLTTGVQYNKLGEEVFAVEGPRITYAGLTLDHPTYFALPAQPRVDRGPRDRGPNRETTTLLAGDDITFDEHWSLLAGVAYSTIDVEARTMYANTAWALPLAGYDESAVTPNVSLIYKPIEAVTTYATYIESLEQGSVAGRDFNGLPVVNAGEVMSPLISEQLEIGAKTQLGGTLLTAALFQIDKSLQYYDLSNPSAVRFVQDGRQVHRGIEFTAFGKLTDNLTITSGFTLLDAKIEEQKQTPALEGRRPPNVAETLIKLRAEYRLPFLPALSLSGGALHTGHQYSDAMNVDRLPGYTLFDIGARFESEVASRPVALRLDVQNVADKAYWSQGITLGEPRTVLLSVSTEF